MDKVKNLEEQINKKRLSSTEKSKGLGGSM